MRALHFACNGAKEDLVVILLDNNVDVNSQDEVGNTALHWASARGILNIAIRYVRCY